MQPFCFWLKSLFGVVAEQIKGEIATTPFISAKCEELKKSISLLLLTPTCALLSCSAMWNLYFLVQRECNRTRCMCSICILKGVNTSVFVVSSVALEPCSKCYVNVKSCPSSLYPYDKAILPSLNSCLCFRLYIGR